MFGIRRFLRSRRGRARPATLILVLLVTPAALFAVRAFREGLIPRITLEPTYTAAAAEHAGISFEDSETARLSRDMGRLEDVWGVAGGSPVGVRHVEAPGDIRAGKPLMVSIHGDHRNGDPFAGALVEVSWEFGDERFRDVTYTDNRGVVDVRRDVPEQVRGKQCLVAVRMSRDGLQSLAYAMFIPR
ncbi:MAG: hypothetical protein HGB10_10845 [Coriobacteriia bacterium]|nr:hypothetical protein [Coriobacteriia bacterium]